MSFGENLRALIYEHDLTQKELANQLNIAPSTMGSYVQNAREPDFNTLKIIAKYFDVSTDFLLDYHSKGSIDHSEADLLRVFRNLTPEQKKLFLEFGKVFVKVNSKND